MARVFVYGTLKRSEHNHHLLQTAEYVGKAFTIDTFKMNCVGFPIIHRDDQGHSVFGEVYDVDMDTLAKLDRLENVGVMYNREKTQVVFPDEQGVIEPDVYIYVGHPDYWSKHSPRQYTTLNDTGELEWHP